MWALDPLIYGRSASDTAPPETAFIVCLNGPWRLSEAAPSYPCCTSRLLLQTALSVSMDDRFEQSVCRGYLDG
jgi:hypothetical protein